MTDLAFDPSHVAAPGHHVVDGRPLADGEPIAVVRPSDGREHGSVPRADAAIVEAAVASATRAAARWAALKPRERGRALRRLADLIDARAEEIARLEAVVSSRPIAECRAIDVPTAAEYLRFYGEWCDKIEGSVTASGTDALSLVLREPYGVAAIVTPWNFRKRCERTASFSLDELSGFVGVSDCARRGRSCADRSRHGLRASRSRR